MKNNLRTTVIILAGLVLATLTDAQESSEEDEQLSVGSGHTNRRSRVI